MSRGKAANPRPHLRPRPLQFWRYLPSVSKSETERIAGAARTTTGSIIIHEMIHDIAQWVRNWPTVTTGKLAIPAAIRLVSPD